MKNFNKKRKKTYNTGELDLNKLSEELIQTKQFSNKSKSKSRKK